MAWASTLSPKLLLRLSERQSLLSNKLLQISVESSEFQNKRKQKNFFFNFFILQTKKQATTYGTFKDTTEKIGKSFDTRFHQIIIHPPLRVMESPLCTTDNHLQPFEGAECKGEQRDKKSSLRNLSVHNAAMCVSEENQYSRPEPRIRSW